MSGGWDGSLVTGLHAHSGPRGSCAVIFPTPEPVLTRQTQNQSWSRFTKRNFKNNSTHYARLFLDPSQHSQHQLKQFVYCCNMGEWPLLPGGRGGGRQGRGGRLGSGGSQRRPRVLWRWPGPVLLWENGGLCPSLRGHAAEKPVSLPSLALLTFACSVWSPGKAGGTRLFLSEGSIWGRLRPTRDPAPQAEVCIPVHVDTRDRVNLMTHDPFTILFCLMEERGPGATVSPESPRTLRLNAKCPGRTLQHAGGFGVG